MKNFGFIAILILLAFSSCRKDEGGMTISDEIPDPDVIENYTQDIVIINSSVIGFVVDEANQPIQGATVTLGDLTTTTDNFGHFFFNDIEMNAAGTLVHISKVGYFEGSRRFFPTPDAKNRVKIGLLGKNFDHSFETTIGGTVTLPSGASVTFGANSIALENGELYTGTVHVAAKWIDPTALATLDQMPGNLQGVGVSTLNEEAVLGTYGMMAVELEGASGEALNIAEGFTATLTMPVPNEIAANAPAEIPLWSFHEGYGIWAEESTATMQNGEYVGEVSHFSWWNCDVPMELIDFTLTLVDENGNPLAYTLIAGTADGIGTAYGYTDANGMESGPIPANVTFTLEVYNVCGDIVYTEDLGPYTEDTDLTITVANPAVNNTTLTGDLTCSGAPVIDGVITASYNGHTTYHYVEGTSFEITLTSCDPITDVTIQGFSAADLTQSEPVTVSLGTTTDLGVIDICEAVLDEYIELTVDGVTRVYPGPSISVDQVNGFTYVEVFDENQAYLIGFGFTGTNTGEYENAHNIELVYDSDNGWDIGHGETFELFSVTEFGATGEAVVGTFSGTMTNFYLGADVSVAVSGSFRVINE